MQTKLQHYMEIITYTSKIRRGELRNNNQYTYENHFKIRQLRPSDFQSFDV